MIDTSMHLLDTTKIISGSIDIHKIINGIYGVKTDMFFYFNQSVRQGHFKY